MTDDQLKEIIQLFAKSLKKMGRAIAYNEQNKSQAHREIEDANVYLSKIIEIVASNEIAKPS